jgi:GNAT superfamily N-acetyltransferase
VRQPRDAPAGRHVLLEDLAKILSDRLRLAHERDALAALTAAVYPPGSAGDGHTVHWAPPEHGILIWGPDGALVAYVGLVVRAGSLDGVPVTIGGVGSVKTHPGLEGRGYASAGLRHAATVLTGDHAVAFSLLVCRDGLLAFYERLGWRAFSGRLLVEQPAGRVEFTLNRPMVLPGRRAAPGGGVIDLHGPPW